MNNQNILENLNDPKIRKEVAREKFSIFFPLYFGHHMSYEFAPMHKEIFQELAKKQADRTMKTVSVLRLPYAFYSWLLEFHPSFKNVKVSYGWIPDEPIEIIVAGKNFGHFDEQFIKNYIPGFFQFVTFHHRMMDPVMLYFDPKIDSKLPDLATCKKRAGMKDESIKHRTLRDAMDVIEVLRYKLYPNSVLI
jgi:hypothetical protein